MLPDFLCIGAQKAGTTWLYHNIRQHPNIWMPPMKEIHYFDDPSILPIITWPLHLTRKRQRHLGRPCTEITTAVPVLQPEEKKRIVYQAIRSLPGNARCIWWFGRYLLSPRGDTWYASLFSPNKKQVTGDMTPSYARLEGNSVARIHTLMPSAKIIYSLRNPIHRMWSQAAMYFTDWGHQRLESIESRQLVNFLGKKQYARNSDYLRTLQIWEKLYPKNQLHIVFFDQLIEDPHSFLRGIYRFLEVDASDRFIPKTVYEKLNAGQYPTIPNHLAHYLASQYYEQITQLHQRFDNLYTASWLEFAERCLHLRG